MTPGEFRAQVHAAGPPQGHPFTPVSECSHPSSSGVDQAPFGDDKVWRCDVCGARYRSVKVDGCLRRAVPVSEDYARPCVGSFAPMSECQTKVTPTGDGYWLAGCACGWSSPWRHDYGGAAIACDRHKGGGVS